MLDDLRCRAASFRLGLSARPFRSCPHSARAWLGACGLAFLLLLGGSCAAPPPDDSADEPATEVRQEATEKPAARPRQGAAVPPVGRWRRPRREPIPADELTPAQRDEIRRLEAIGYAAAGREAAASWGVTRFDPERTWTGLNLVVSADAPRAVLMDMEGRELHRWQMRFEEAWPGRELPNREATYWRRAWVLDDGSLLAIFEGHGLIEIDRDSQLIWARDIAAHHDLHLDPDGTIWVLTRQAHLVPRIDPERPILEDFVSILDPSGREVDRMSILEALERSAVDVDWRRGLDEVLAESGDIFHTNTLERLSRSHPAGLAGFEKGNFLLSIPKLDLIAVLDPEKRAVVWAHRGTFRYQHDPRMLENGRLLVFDNHGAESGSRVLELDPATREVVWSYAGSAVSPFFSRTCGLAQRLPNGNTLITETEAGRAFEVTRQGEIVWEYLSPHRAGEDDRLVAMLMETTRLPWREPPAWVRAADGDATDGDATDGSSR